MSYVSKKALVLFIVCSKCSYKYIRKYIIMTEKNISQEFRLKNIDKIRNCFIEEIN